MRKQIIYAMKIIKNKILYNMKNGDKEQSDEKTRDYLVMLFKIKLVEKTVLQIFGWESTTVYHKISKLYARSYDKCVLCTSYHIID